MTPQDLRRLQADLSLSVRSLSWLTGSTTRQVSRWRTGVSPIPQPVRLLLLAYQQGLLSPRWMVEQLGPPD